MEVSDDYKKVPKEYWAKIKRENPILYKSIKETIDDKDLVSPSCDYSNYPWKYILDARDGINELRKIDNMDLETLERLLYFSTRKTEKEIKQYLHIIECIKSKQ